jgi:hypothetical protein
MEGKMSFSSPLDARQFLINKIVAQSVRTGDRLSDVDRRMLLLNLYENRIVGLLKSAYERDRNYAEERQRYRQALQELVGTKHYVLMIASAAIGDEDASSSNTVIYVIIALATAGIIALLAWWTRPR